MMKKFVKTTRWLVHCGPPDFSAIRDHQSMVHTSTPDIIHSPNNVSCKWSIRDLSGGKIELNIYDFQTEVCRSSLDPSKSCNEPCRYDYLEIHDGNSSQIGDRLCGNITGLYRNENNSTSPYHQHPSPWFPLKTIVSYTDNLDLYWRSDESISSKGFKISVKSNGK